MSGGVEHDLRRPRPRSRIAQERLWPGTPSWGYVATTGALALAVFAFLALVSNRPPETLIAEEAAAEVPSALAALRLTLGLSAVRVLAAVAGACFVVAVAAVARRLMRSEATALLAVWIVAVDPALLAVGHLAVPHAFVLATAFGALALFMMPRSEAHWGGACLLALGALFDPAVLLWGIPVGMLVLVRGHIYAAPVHLATTAAQTLLIPALAGGIVVAARALTGTEACRLPSLPALLLARHERFGDVLVLPDPALWLAGLASLAVLAAAIVGQALASFRLARLPGRLQLRLPTPLRPSQARVLWIALLALFVPHPLLWLPLAALGLAAAVGYLAEDAPGFGFTVGIVAAAFALLWTFRAVGTVLGTADAAAIEDLLAIVPWSTPATC